MLSVPALAGEWSTCMKKSGAVWEQDLARWHSSAQIDGEKDELSRLLLEPTERRPSSDPNGRVEILIRRSTIGLADPSNLIFVWVSSDGRKIGEQRGLASVGSPPPAPGPFMGSGYYWWNMAILSVPTSPTGLALHVVDTVTSDKCIFYLDPSARNGIRQSLYVR